MLISYWYCKKRNFADLVEILGYKPEILLDSGAYTAFNKGKIIRLEDYMDFIERNREYITHYISLDVIQDISGTLANYRRLKDNGYNPIPVFHYRSDERILEYYIENGESYIALGATVPIKNKSIVAEWTQDLCMRYPEIKFHVLGSSSKKILEKCSIYSADSSTWIMQSAMGSPKHISQKIDRLRYNMTETMERVS